MELYRQLRPVVDDLPARLCSRSCVCLAEAAYSKAVKQKERFRKQLVQKLHKSSSAPALFFRSPCDVVLPQQRLIFQRSKS